MRKNSSASRRSMRRRPTIRRRSIARIDARRRPRRHRRGADRYRRAAGRRPSRSPPTGSRKRKRAMPPSRRAAGSPPTRSPRLPSRHRNDPRRPFSHCGRAARARRRLARRPAGRRRHHLAGHADRDLADGFGRGAARGDGGACSDLDARFAPSCARHSYCRVHAPSPRRARL